MNPQHIGAALERILISRAFASSRRMSRFLRFVVDETLAGRGDSLKETTVGHAVFDRAVDYDPRLDPIVRVEARRLRAKLEKYYQGEGRHEEIVIQLPLGAYTPVIGAAGATTSEPTAVPTKTIAVLPFANLSQDPENEYFSDGLTHELIHVLTRVPGLRVMAWNSAVQLRDRRQPATEMARKLSVDAVLEGAVRRSGARLRISVQLIDAGTGLYIWSETFQRQMRDLFSLQEELARSMVTALKIRWSGDALSALRSGAGSVDAYGDYLRGRHAWNRRSEQGMRESIVFYQRAITQDPNCALAYAGLADSITILSDYGLEPSSPAILQARSAALKALQIDPTLAEAHNSLGMIVAVHDWQWEEAERHFLRALELNPGYANAHHWYGGDLLAFLGRFEQGAKELGIARQLDPLNYIVSESESYHYMLWRRFNLAEQGYQRLMVDAPDFAKSYTGMGRVLAAQGRYREAIEMLEKGRPLAGESPSLLGALGQVHGMNGNRREAESYLRALHEMARHRHVNSICFALAHLGLGEKPEALDRLEKSCNDREMALVAAGVHPAYDDLRSEPRFQGILDRIGV